MKGFSPKKTALRRPLHFPALDRAKEFEPKFFVDLLWAKPNRGSNIKSRVPAQHAINFAFPTFGAGEGI